MVLEDYTGLSSQDVLDKHAVFMELQQETELRAHVHSSHLCIFQAMSSVCSADAAREKNIIQVSDRLHFDRL